MSDEDWLISKKPFSIPIFVQVIIIIGKKSVLMQTYCSNERVIIYTCPFGNHRQEDMPTIVKYLRKLEENNYKTKTKLKTVKQNVKI